MPLSKTDLILNKDGSVYHLNLLSEDIADLIITVGDPARVAAVSRYFDTIELKKQKREFITHTGTLGSQRITVISTGISTDNIDIVFNELDALVNIDLHQRASKPRLKSLCIIRIGTAGSLQVDIPLDSFVVSQHAIGLEGLAHFYAMHSSSEEILLQKKFAAAFGEESYLQSCYAVAGDPALINLLGNLHFIGTTVTCGGFYAPQGRMLRALPKISDFAQRLSQLGMANFEMETAGIYTMGRILGHRTCSISAIVANRITHQFSLHPEETIDKLIRFVLEKISLTTDTKIA